MINKDNIIPLEKNSVYTPEAVNEALESLPTNYVIKVKAILDDWFDNKTIDKTYSKVYISRVKNRDKEAFNEDIMKALVKVGLEHKITLNQFGRKPKKNLSTN
jgi:hypothetical protein